MTFLRIKRLTLPLIFNGLLMMSVGADFNSASGYSLPVPQPEIATCGDSGTQNALPRNAKAINLYLLIDESKTANTSDRGGAIRYDVARRVVEYAVAFGQLSGAPPHVHIYQYSSGLQNGVGSHRSTREIFPQIGGDQAVYFNRVPDNGAQGRYSTLYDVFASLTPHPTNNVEYLDETLTFLKGQVSQGDKAHSVVLIVTQGYPAIEGQTSNQINSNLHQAAQAWGNFNVPINVILSGKDTNKLQDYATLWQENFYAEPAAPSLNGFEPRILPGIPTLAHAQVWKWMTAIYQQQNWFGEMRVEPHLLNQEVETIQIPEPLQKIEVLAFETDFDEAQQAISVISSSGGAPVTDRPSVPTNDQSLILRWVSDGPTALASDWSISRKPQDDPTYYLISRTPQQFYIRVDPLMPIMGSPASITPIFKMSDLGQKVIYTGQILDQDKAGQVTMLDDSFTLSSGAIYTFTPQLDNFHDNWAGERWATVTITRTEGTTTATHICTFRIVRPPRITGEVLGAVKPGEDLSVRLTISDAHLFAFPVVPVLELKGSSISKFDSLSGPDPAPTSPTYQGFSVYTGTIRLNLPLPARIVARIAGQTTQGVVMNDEWSQELSLEEQAMSTVVPVLLITALMLLFLMTPYLLLALAKDGHAKIYQKLKLAFWADEEIVKAVRVLVAAAASVLMTSILGLLNIDHWLLILNLFLLSASLMGIVFIVIYLRFATEDQISILALVVQCILVLFWPLWLNLGLPDLLGPKLLDSLSKTIEWSLVCYLAVTVAWLLIHPNYQKVRGHVREFIKMIQGSVNEEKPSG